MNIIPIGGSSGGGASAPVLYDATNAQRLAGTNGTRVFVALDIVRVTDQGNRIEQYLGGTASDNANWAVLRNTINLTVGNGNGGANVVLNGVSVPNGTDTNLGWVYADYLSMVVNDYTSSLYTINAEWNYSSTAGYADQISLDGCFDRFSTVLSVPKVYPDRCQDAYFYFI